MILILILLLLFSCLEIFSQVDSSESFNLPETKIYQKVKNNEKIYKFDEDANRFILRDTLLIADTSVYKYKVTYKDITKVLFRDGSCFDRGLLIGLVSGIALGTLITLTSGDSNGGGHPGFTLPAGIAYILILPTTIIGGIIGAITPNYEEFTFSGVPEAQKKTKLIKILRNNRIE